jgi:hypothetical protein
MMNPITDLNISLWTNDDNDDDDDVVPSFVDDGDG